MGGHVQVEDATTRSGIHIYCARHRHRLHDLLHYSAMEIICSLAMDVIGRRQLLNYCLLFCGFLWKERMSPIPE